MDAGELSPDEIGPLAEASTVDPLARTLLRMTKFIAAEILVFGFSRSFEFWSLIAEKVRLQVMPNAPVIDTLIPAPDA